VTEPAPPRRSPGRAVRELLFGHPLRISQLTHERITPIEGLPALSLDALTSVAYGPQAILVTLAAAGVAALHLILPITVAIVILLTILVISYRQVIVAYPGGGGAYAVSRANFGPKVSQLAAAALVIDYTLTVAVSVSSGVESLVSAFPALSSGTLPLCLGILALITVLNLRGLGDSARAFLLPTLVFVVGLLVVIAIGLVHPLARNLQHASGGTVVTHAVEAVGILLILKAFSAGCSALTGVEAIANGVPLFREPRVVRAKRTEALLGVILGTMLLGLAVLVDRFHVEPSSTQTVLSEIMSISLGRNWAYYTMSITITVVLALAANTSFGGLPILASLLSRDNYLPHLFSLRDDRQTFSVGIWVLTAMAGVLLVAVDGKTDTLIPLFAIGVFIGFTLAQAGLVVHWRRERPDGWQRRAAINGLGAVVTGVAAVIFLLSKFTSGAWVVVLAIPAFILLFHRIEAYYVRVGEKLGIGSVPPPPSPKPSTVVVPVMSVSRLAQRAVSEALSIGERVVVVHVVFDSEEGPADTSEIERLWAKWSPGVPLEILRTEYASVVDPIVRYVESLCQGDRQVVVLIPVIEPDRLRHRILHNHADLSLRFAFRHRRDVIFARVVFNLDEL
jgi:amino acid transporter